MVVPPRGKFCGHPFALLLCLLKLRTQSKHEKHQQHDEQEDCKPYDTQLYFSRVFKKEYGISPAQYRKRAENQSAAQMESDVGEITCEN